MRIDHLSWITIIVTAAATAIWALSAPGQEVVTGTIKDLTQVQYASCSKGGYCESTYYATVYAEGANHSVKISELDYAVYKKDISYKFSRAALGLNKANEGLCSSIFGLAIIGLGIAALVCPSREYFWSMEDDAKKVKENEAAALREGYQLFQRLINKQADK